MPEVFFVEVVVLLDAALLELVGLAFVVGLVLALVFVEDLAADLVADGLGVALVAALQSGL